MADRGKASKVVVKKLVEDIRFFSKAVKNESKKMMSIAQELNSQWNDPQYKNFLKFMEDLTSSLIADTKDLDYTATKVEERELKEL